MRAPLVMALAITVVLGNLAQPLGATQVPLVVRPIQLDGDLREWGRAAWIDVLPAGDGVGLRGVFRNGDHEAVILVHWDAEALYVAAAVEDDTLDAGVIAPDEREWHGPAGERKDRVFYFDHLKIFVREPGADAGYNLWFAPAHGETAQPYWWGGRQRQADSVRPPVQVAGLVRGTTRTFEVAIPWTWMDAYPQPGDEFDAMFLFTDSDKPGDEVAVKIARKEDRWIWWQGKLQLSGTPDGLRPRPPPEKPLSRRPATVPKKPLDARVADAIARSRQAGAAEQEAAPEGETVAATSMAPAPTAAVDATTPAGTAPEATNSGATTVDPGAGPSEVVANTSGSATGSLRARLNRQLLARRRGLQAPDYWRDLERDKSLTPTQIDSFYGVVQRHLQRAVGQRITSRIDFYVVDAATAASCRRDQSRKYLVDLLARLSGTHDAIVRDWIQQAAVQARVDPAAATKFVRSIADEARGVLSERGITTSQELFKLGRKQSGLSQEDAYGLAQSLLGELP